MKEFRTQTAATLRLGTSESKVKIGGSFVKGSRLICIEIDGGSRRRGVCALTLQDAIKVADTIQGLVASVATGQEMIK